MTVLTFVCLCCCSLSFMNFSSCCFSICIDRISDLCHQLITFFFSLKVFSKFNSGRSFKTFFKSNCGVRFSAFISCSLWRRLGVVESILFGVMLFIFCRSFAPFLFFFSLLVFIWRNSCGVIRVMFSTVSLRHEKFFALFSTRKKWHKELRESNKRT